jgi:hypothetical protein
VNVIRHDQVTANRNIMLSRSARTVIPKDGCDSMQVVDFLPISCAECDEIKRRSRKNTVRPMRPIVNHDLLYWQACRLQRVEQNAADTAHTTASAALSLLGSKRRHIGATIRKLQPARLPLQLRAELAGVTAEANRIKSATRRV